VQAPGGFQCRLVDEKAVEDGKDGEVTDTHARVLIRWFWILGRQ